MVAYLIKSDASEGFNQVIDFLNQSYVKYALTVNPNIYVSCIKQFWNTVTIKQDNNVTRMQALVDKKKVVVTEDTIRDVLRLDDAEGVDCLPNEEIFAKLTRMGYEKPSTKLIFYKAFFSSQWKFLIHTILQSMSAKRTSWNEFSSAMASAVICLSTCRKFNFSKYIFDSLDKRLRKEEMKKSMLKMLLLRIDTSDDTMMDDESNQGRIIDEMDKDDVVAMMNDKENDKKDEEAKVDESALPKEDEPTEVHEVVDVVTTTKLIAEVVTVTSKTISAASTIIFAAEPQVSAATITAAPTKVAAAFSRRRNGVVIRDPEEESITSSIIPTETKSKDKDVAIDHVKLKAKEDPVVQRYQAMKRKPQTEAQAQKNMMMYLKNVDGFRLYYFKGMSYDDIHPIFEAKFNSNIEFLLKTKEQMKEEENRALQSINETPAQKAAKRRKLNKEVKDLKRHLEIVPDEDDDVYTEATPLARKVLVVDYEIIEINNKPYYKIIRADGTHQLYISFLTVLKNFDREDLDTLWNLVRERFSTSKPKNFFDDFVLTTLRAMFEKPDEQAQV
nr:hypothetical protein [Tanacetum cinerariifolium]